MTEMTGSGRAGRGSRWSWLVWAAAGGLLLVPLVAMQFTDEVDWTVSDFAVMGGLLAFVCGAWELALRMSGHFAYRAGFGLAIVTGFLLVWVNLAVGLVGSEDNPINLVFFGVLALGIIASCIAAFEPKGMARAMALTAAAQGAVALYAAVMGGGRLAVLIGGFAAMWLISAALFRRAARARVPA